MARFEGKHGPKASIISGSFRTVDDQSARDTLPSWHQSFWLKNAFAKKWATSKSESLAYFNLRENYLLLYVKTALAIWWQLPYLHNWQVLHFDHEVFSHISSLLHPIFVQYYLKNVYKCRHEEEGSVKLYT
jgi:hypothetical protein